jgi:hypothetical protein
MIYIYIYMNNNVPNFDHFVFINIAHHGVHVVAR